MVRDHGSAVAAVSSRLLFGAIVASAVGVFVVLSMRRVRRRLVSAWTGPESALADALLTVSLITFVANVLGAIGHFAAWPLLGGLLVAGAAGWAWGTPRAAPAAGSEHGHPNAEDESPKVPLTELPGWAPYAVGAVTALVATAWWSQLPQAHRQGIFDWDSLWYHLPMAATFVRTGHFLPLHLYDADIVVSTYPAGSDVFHAIGMLAFGVDVVSPLINTMWASLFLLATHVFGRRFGVGHVGTLIGLTALAFPMVIQLEAVSALAEMMALACLASALAVAVASGGATPRDTNQHSSPGQIILVGLAIGLMASTKLVMLGPAVALFLGLIMVFSRGHKPALRRTILPMTMATAATGAFWYIRNLIVFGSPVPALHLGVGSFRLASVEQDGTFATMLPTLVKGFSHGNTVPAMAQTFGPLWFVVGGCALAPLIISLRRHGPRDITIIAIIGISMWVLGLLTPQYALDGTYLNLFANGRYLLAGIVVTLLASVAALSHGERNQFRLFVASLGFAVLTLTGFLSRPARNVWWGVYPASFPWLMALAAVGASAIIVAAARNLGGLPLPIRWTGTLTATMIVGLSMFAVFSPQPVERFRMNDVRPEVYEWAHRQTDRTIAIEPFDYADFSRLRQGDVAWIQRRYSLIITYPLYGNRLTNTVVPVARFDGTKVIRPTTCKAWWNELRRIGADDVLLWRDGGPEPTSKYEEWTVRSTSTQLVASQPVGRRPGGRLLLYRVDTARAPNC